MPIADEEVRTVIDKLAVFVAKNGDAFENITKEKQRDNPKFAFLFGGEVRSKHLASEKAAACSLSDTFDRPCTVYGADRGCDWLTSTHPTALPCVQHYNYYRYKVWEEQQRDYQEKCVAMTPLLGHA
jgi:hypothetical protein